MANACTHLDQIGADVTPNTTDGCEECLAQGMEWVQLRMCLTCGHVGCCNSSEGKHATKHFKQTDHPIVQAYQSGDDWRWCYVDEVYLNR